MNIDEKKELGLCLGCLKNINIIIIINQIKNIYILKIKKKKSRNPVGGGVVSRVASPEC
jgi:hypothetical protein